MKSQPVLSFNRLKGVSSLVVYAFLLSSIAIGNVYAAKGGKGKPGPEPVGVYKSDVRWGGDEPTPGVLEANYRLCNLTEAAADMFSGTYTCNRTGARVFYDFANFITDVAHSRGDDSYCSTIGSQFYIDPDLEYSFSWEGNCSSASGCAVKVVNRFSNVAVLGGPVTRLRLDPLLDRLMFEGFGRISNSTPNPFNMSQSVTIDYMHITYYGSKGKGKALAVCSALPMHENFPVKFETEFVPGS